MFWRILQQLFLASRGRLVVALIALASGAAVTTALVNLHLDAERKLSTEFQTLGPNVLISPELPRGVQIIDVKDFSLNLEDPRPPQEDSTASPLMTRAVMDRLAAIPELEKAIAAPFLYVVAMAEVNGKTQSLIVAGTWLDRTAGLFPWWKISGSQVLDHNDTTHCFVGRNVATTLGLAPNSKIELGYTNKSAIRMEILTVAGIIETGGEEDNQIIADIGVAQQLVGLNESSPNIMLIRASIPGTPAEVEHAVTQISAALPDLDVRPIPQIAQAEGQLLPRIQGLIYAMVALILVLTALCVFASMAALAMERRRDVGLMKAIGGKMSRIVALFLTEAGALGLAGALIGYAAGIFLSRWIGWRAFGVAINARLEVLPLVVALMVGVALAGAFPLRLLGRVRPAEILRGE
jgi:putative ABC transport system permease protein